MKQWGGWARQALAMGCALGVGIPLFAQKLSEPAPERVHVVSELIGNKLTVAPKKERKVLVFWRCEGFVHRESIELGNKAFELAAAQTKAFSVDLSNDYAVLRPENLARYDALILNNTTGLKTEDPANSFIEPALLEFVRSGKGLHVVHAGVDNFYKAGACAEMCGGLFLNHPWGAGGTWSFKVEEPDHALCATSLKAIGPVFKFSDEIYQQRSPFYNRAKLRVLVSLNMDDPDTAKPGGQQRKDRDYAVSWLRPYGKGRVFYTSFAHDHRAWMHKEILWHMLDGLQYVLGDLAADDTPHGLSESDLQMVKTTANDSEYIAAFTFLQDILANTRVAQVDKANIAKLQALAYDSATTRFGFKAIVRALQTVNAAWEPAKMGAFLKQPETRDWAIQALAHDSSAASLKVLTAALASAPPAEQPQLINALAAHRASAPIIPYLKSSEQAVAVAALNTLGRIADPAALKALMQYKPVAPLAGVHGNAIAAALGGFAVRNETSKARREAQAIFQDQAQAATTRAAAAGLLLADNSNFFEQGMRDASALVRSAILRDVSTVKPEALAKVMAQATPVDQAALATKLADKNSKKHASEIAVLLQSPAEDTVTAALVALRRLNAVEYVAQIMAQLQRPQPIGRAAREALLDMADTGTVAAMIKVAGDDLNQQRVVMGIIGERLESASLPALEVFTKASDTGLRREAWKAAHRLVDAKTAPALWSWLKAIQEPEVVQVENALQAAMKLMPAPAAVQLWQSNWQNASLPSKQVLANLAKGLGDDALVQALIAGLKEPNQDLARTILQTLGDWPTAKPIQPLLQSINTLGDDVRSVALRNSLKLLAKHQSQGFIPQALQLMKNAKGANDERSIGDAILNQYGLMAFTELQKLAHDAQLGASAKKVYIDLAQRVADAPLPDSELDPKGWKATASHNGNNVGRAFDRNPGTRWDTGAASVPGMWFAVDLQKAVSINEIVLDTNNSANDTPNGCEVFISNDGKDWAGPVAAIDGNTKHRSVIKLTAHTRHLKFVTTGARQGLYWSIHELFIKSGLDQQQLKQIQDTAKTLQ